MKASEYPKKYTLEDGTRVENPRNGLWETAEEDGRMKGHKPLSAEMKALIESIGEFHEKQLRKLKEK